jgi:hypothetical protein
LGLLTPAEFSSTIGLSIPLLHRVSDMF